MDSQLATAAASPPDVWLLAAAHILLGLGYTLLAGGLGAVAARRPHCLRTGGLVVALCALTAVECLAEAAMAFWPPFRLLAVTAVASCAIGVWVCLVVAVRLLTRPRPRPGRGAGSGPRPRPPTAVSPDDDSVTAASISTLDRVAANLTLMLADFTDGPPPPAPPATSA